jgi:hypothetical protein
VSIHYELTHRGKRGLLLQDVQYPTPIIGHAAQIDENGMRCQIERGGTLTVYSGFSWDFGSGPAIDTPSVVYASLAHDAFCHLTNRRLIPWTCRAIADRYYRELLKMNGTSLPRRWWQWAAVSIYSQGVARWRDKQ